MHLASIVAILLLFGNETLVLEPFGSTNWYGVQVKCGAGTVPEPDDIILLAYTRYLVYLITRFLTRSHCIRVPIQGQFCMEVCEL